MSLTIGDITFDRVEYDADGDVLYSTSATPPARSTSMRRLKDMRCA